MDLLIGMQHVIKYFDLFKDTSRNIIMPYYLETTLLVHNSHPYSLPVYKLAFTISLRVVQLSL